MSGSVIRLFYGINTVADMADVMAILFGLSAFKAWTNREPIPMWISVVVSALCVGFVIFWYAY